MLGLIYCCAQEKAFYKITITAQRITTIKVAIALIATCVYEYRTDYTSNRGWFGYHMR